MRVAALRAPAPRWVVLAFAACFALLCAAGLHGFSLAVWDRLLGGDAHEVLLGAPQTIRSDDWVVGLPLVFAQRAHEPRFPVFNEKIGYGADMRVGYPVPTRSWLSLLRPQMWGYFVGADFGMAWHWWSRLLGLGLAGFLALHLVTPSRPGLALLCALAIPFAPFFQFWSFSCEPIGAMFFLCFVAAGRLALARDALRAAAWGALLAWAGGCFVLGFVYPPFQIPLGYAFLFLLGGFLWRERAGVRAAGAGRARVLAALGAVLVVGLALAVYCWQSAPALRLMAGTVYPGQRRSAGGELTVLHLFNAFFTPFGGRESYAAFGNASEAGGFFHFFPLLLGIAAWRFLTQRRRPDPVLVALAAPLAIFVVYGLGGLPTAVCRFSLLDRTTGARSVIVLGLVAAFLPGLVAASESEPRAPSARWRTALAGAALWSAVLAWIGVRASATTSWLSAATLIAALAAAFCVGILVLRHPTAGAAAVLAGGIAATAWFNPLARGGAEFVRDNPLSREIARLDRETGRASRWVVYSDDVAMPNLLRAIGVNAVNGLHPYPQLALWERVDLKNPHSEAYNRYAHVRFQLPETRTRVTVELPQSDLITLRIHPDHPAFARLDVDFVLFGTRSREPPVESERLRLVTRVGERWIYRYLRD